MNMKITNAAQLKEAIATLEIHTAIKKSVVVEQFHETYESLKPVNIIKHTFKDFIDVPGMADNFIGSSIGLGAGILSKKILVGKPTNIFKRILGTAVELIVAKTVTKNSDGITSKAFGLIKKLIKNNSDHITT